MEFTTLCYIERNDEYLMLHRIRKKNDINEGKWIGVGGHFEPGESPEECLLREVKEETGLLLKQWIFRGIITFTFQKDPFDIPLTEYMCLYTAQQWEGEMTECDEGELSWIKKNQVMDLNLWEGDRIFLKLLLENPSFFSLKLSYIGDELVEAVQDGCKIFV